ncbi:hypothetical protein [Sphingosinicella sp. BN140058]|uniref:hypothetical protein n=1 Tax=Sphingosinicella sp. BN140058 TaxID=1892855 RepID=UPI001011A2B0|nr:hypothetical protein [Sphingosinicella sp. BN140058]QAY80362.1 hypothetical protein ETR14_27360 [Sphingosinicella sp. BN140058]
MTTECACGAAAPTFPSSNLEACHAILVSLEALFRKHQSRAGSQARLSITMNNGKEHTGTEISLVEGVWFIKSGGDYTLVNPLSISTARLIG